MDISAAVDEFVSLGRRLYQQLRAEGQALSNLQRHILLAQLQVLHTEVSRLRDPHLPRLRTLQPASAPVPAVSHQHSLDLYKDKEFLIEEVIAFVRVGLEMQDTVLILATKKLREGIEGSLHPDELKNKRLFFIDVKDLLSRFMVDDWPDESKFMDVMSIGLMLSENARVRIFQEMSSLLWTQATPDAALRLEELLNKLISQKPIRLLCSYPLSHFSGEAGRQLQDKVCELHRYLNIQKKF
jgi:MEDS: MEthanogen/methylotroph, DcmR Sensory domain